MNSLLRMKLTSNQIIHSFDKLSYAKIINKYIRRFILRSACIVLDIFPVYITKISFSCRILSKMAEDEEKKKEHFIRLLTFITGPATETLHLYFEIKVLKSLDFFIFLDNHKHILVHQLHQSTKCCECKTGDIKQISRLTPVQFDLLFETDERREINGHKRTKGPEIIQICLCSISAKRTTTVDLMDISLMSAVLNSCCPPGSISGNPKWIKDIKETRNLIAHSPSDKISKSEYVQKFTLIEKSVLKIADVIGPVFLKMTKENISSFKDSDLSIIINKDLKKNSNDNIRQV